MSDNTTGMTVAEAVQALTDAGVLNTPDNPATHYSQVAGLQGCSAQHIHTWYMWDGRNGETFAQHIERTLKADGLAPDDGCADWEAIAQSVLDELA